MDAMEDTCSNGHDDWLGVMKGEAMTHSSYSFSQLQSHNYTRYVFVSLRA